VGEDEFVFPLWYIFREILSKGPTEVSSVQLRADEKTLTLPRSLSWSWEMPIYDIFLFFVFLCGY
jgi:hypothetical protein